MTDFEQKIILNLDQFRTFRCFHKPVTGRELFLEARYFEAALLQFILKPLVLYYVPPF